MIDKTYTGPVKIEIGINPQLKFYEVERNLSRRVVLVMVPERFVLDTYVERIKHLPTRVGFPVLRAGLPEGAVLQYAVHLPLEKVFAFRVQHPSFKEVAPQLHPPQWNSLGTMELEWFEVKPRTPTADEPTVVG